MAAIKINPAPINSRLNVVARSPTPFRLSQNGCWTSRKSQLLRALLFIFSQCCPLNDCRRAAHNFLKIDRLFSFSLFSCSSLARLCLLILLFLLMSGNVHTNPGPIFPCSMCAGNVTWRGKSMQFCTCSKWVHLRCSQLSLSKFRAHDNCHSWSCPLLCLHSQHGDSPRTPPTCIPPLYNQSRPLSANAALPPHHRLQTSYPPSAHSVSSPSAPSPLSLAPGCPSAPPAFSPP